MNTSYDCASVSGCGCAVCVYVCAWVCKSVNYENGHRTYARAHYWIERRICGSAHDWNNGERMKEKLQEWERWEESEQCDPAPAHQTYNATSKRKSPEQCSCFVNRPNNSIQLYMCGIDYVLRIISQLNFEFGHIVCEKIRLKLTNCLQLAFLFKAYARARVCVLNVLFRCDLLHITVDFNLKRCQMSLTKMLHIRNTLNLSHWTWNMHSSACHLLLK